MNMRPVDEVRIREEEAGHNFVEYLCLEFFTRVQSPKLPKIVRKRTKSMDLSTPPGWSVTQRKSAACSTFTCW